LSFEIQHIKNFRMFVLFYFEIFFVKKNDVKRKKNTLKSFKQDLYENCKALLIAQHEILCGL